MFYIQSQNIPNQTGGVLYSRIGVGQAHQVTLDTVAALSTAPDGIVFYDDHGYAYKYTPGSGWTYVPKTSPVTDFGSSLPVWMQIAGYYSSAHVTYPRSNESSNNWSGYEVRGQATAVGGSWTQPAITGSVNSDTSIWVGIGGDSAAGSSSLVQLGTDASIDGNGHAEYQAWWEMVPNTPNSEVPITQTNSGAPFTVNHGDVISASIFLISTKGAISTYYMTIQDQSPSGAVESYSRSVQFVNAVNTCAEWVVEAPTQNGNHIATLPNFGQVKFVGAWATLGTTTTAIDGFAQNYVITLRDPDGGVSTPSMTLTDSYSPGFMDPVTGSWSSSFTVTYSAN